MTTQTPDLDKIKKTLLKVKELAERGEDGERVSAQNKLTSILKKYNINVSDIESEECIERDIKHNRDPDSRTILVQVILSVSDSSVFVTKGQSCAHAKLTSTQYIEVVEKYKYYWELYKKQKAIFIRAFITRNGLFSINPDNTTTAKISEQEKNEVTRMMMSLTKGDFDSGKEKKVALIGN